MPPIFHLTTRAELEAARATGELVPESVASQGFTHCSFRDQLVVIADAIFASVEDLMILELDPAAVGEVRVEAADPTIDAPVPPEQQFPHIYGPVPLIAIRREHRFPREAGGGYRLPPPLEARARADAAALEALLAAYAWYDHPEGPKFVETHRDAHRTNGHWLFVPGAISAFHRVVNNEELWLAQRGSLRIHVIDDAGRHTSQVLGLHVAGGEQPVIAVPQGVWQAAELVPGEPFAFGSNVCAPPFSFEADGFELAERAPLIERFVAHADLIARLTHG